MIIGRYLFIVNLGITMAVWLVADFGVRSYQVTLNFNRSNNFETGTATAINYTACCAAFFIPFLYGTIDTLFLIHQSITHFHLPYKLYNYQI
jgi:hypothetical protein